MMEQSVNLQESRRCVMWLDDGSECWLEVDDRDVCPVHGPSGRVVVRIEGETR